MAGGKLTPRQKMINMMYLVLTALLALNVSTEVLNAFRLVNEGLQSSNSSLNGKNDGIYKAFEKQMEQDAGKAKPHYDKALLAQKVSRDLYNLLQQYKDTLIAEAKGINPETGEIEERDNIDIATRILVEERSKTKDGKQKGKDLQERIQQTRKQLFDLLDEKDRANFKLPLNADDIKTKPGEDKKTWEFATFNHVPVTAAVTILTKFQNDVISSEGAVIEYLIKKIGETDFKFDALAAKIIAPSSYIMQGQSYKADIFLAAFNSTQQPEVFLGPLSGFTKAKDGSYEKLDSNNPLPAGYSESGMLKTEGGMAKLEQGGAAVGEKKYTGIIRVKNPAGGYTFYPFEGGYQVAAKAVVVSPTKMNVLYIGVDNPMKISVPGVGQNDVTANLDGAGTLTKNPDGSYTAKVTAVGKCKIAVAAKIDGKVQSMGEEEFRIKRIPDPVPTLGGKLRGGNTQPGSIKAQSGVVALLENFDFEARFDVVSFQMVFSSKGEIFKAEAQGPLLNAQMKSFLDRAKPKDIIFIDEIKVVGPDKQPRKLGQIAFTII
ncbi:MAG: gliding motility protein GldM [Chitinophagales bacterium]|nr:gliding motility protein GldM [Chitinophagales bacterium]